MNSVNAPIRGKVRLVIVTMLGLFLLALPGDASVRYPDRGRGGLNPRLLVLLHQVDAHFGRHAMVVSGCRTRAHNRAVGGARESYHLRCMAADLFVPGISKYNLYRFLARLPGRGGVGTYCRSAFVHVDVGPVREWAWGCGRKFKKLSRRGHRRR